MKEEQAGDRDIEEEEGGPRASEMKKEHGKDQEGQKVEGGPRAAEVKREQEEDQEEDKKPKEDSTWERTTNKKK